MTRKRSSPMGLEIYLLAFIMLPLLTQAAPLQDYTEIQQYTEGCYYNYNHYNEGDRIMTNEPCLNCTCHNKMLMCYLRVCPFTKPIGHDCIVEKREDQCCPIITCPEVPVDVAHAVPEPGTELSFPEKFGCSIDGKFYLEGAQVPSNPSKPCELCYCIKNRTSCLMQECTLHIDGCTPIYNKGSCCPVRYNCDHENDVLELEDHSTTTEAATTTTERPTTGFIIASTMSPSVSTDCIHNGELYADGARILGETACENCYCMRGDIICAVQECHMPMLNSNGKSCHALPAAEGECCPSNYVCEDESSTTEIIEASTLSYDNIEEDVKVTTATPIKDLHSGIPEEDLQLQTHIDEEEAATKVPATESKPEKEEESVTKDSEKGEVTTTTSIGVHEPIESDDSLTKPEEESKTESSETGISEAPIQKDQDQHVADVKPTSEKESVTKVPSAAAVLPEVSTATIESVEKETSATEKSEIMEIVTNAPVTDDVRTQEVTSEPSEDTTQPIVEEEYVTLSPISVEKLSTTKVPLVGEQENIPEESHEDVTKGSMDMEQTTEVFEEVSTKAPLTVETPEKSVENKQKEPIEGSGDESYEQSTKTTGAEEETETQHVVTEGDLTVTTVSPEKISVESEEKILTEIPKETAKPEEEYTGATESDEESKLHSAEELSTSVPAIEGVHTSSIDMSIEPEKAVTKLPVSADEEQEFVTTSSSIKEEENKDNSIPTETPTFAPSDSTEEKTQGSTDTSEGDENISGEGKPLATDKVEIDRIGESQTEDHTGSPAPFDNEFGSGDYSTEVSNANEETSQPSVISSSTETIVIPESQEKDITSIISIEDKLSEGEEPMTTEISKQPSESQDDTKLIDLTTAKFSEENISVTTTKTSEVDTTTSSTKTFEEVSEKASEFTTIKTIADEYPVKEQSTEKPAEFEEASTQEFTESSTQQTTAMPTSDTVHESEEDHHKILPEIGDHTSEKPTEITDNPMVINEDAETQTEKEHKMESTTVFTAKMEEDTASTTVKPFIEPTHIKEMPDMQLPSFIPGEGDCLVGQKTYQNNTIVPTSDECEIVCKCVSSIVSCERVICAVPENSEKCVLDENSNNKCCPSYICATSSVPSKAEDSMESTEEDEDEEIPYTTIAAPHKISEQPILLEEAEKKPVDTTAKPSAATEGVAPGIIIPEIETPIASTEEPMSHVKDEEEIYEIEATKAPIKVTAEDKKDIYDESEVHTTPSAVAENSVVPQSISPVKISDQEQPHIVTDKAPVGSTEKHVEPEISAGQQYPENEVTTAGFLESVTDSPAAHGMQVKPTEKEEDSKGLLDHSGKPIASQEADTTPTSDDEKVPESETKSPTPTSSAEDKIADHVPPAETESEPKSQTTTATTSPEKETETEDEYKTHTTISSIPAEKDAKSEVPEEQTTLPTISTKEEDQLLSVPFDLEKETQTAKPMDTSTISTEVISEHTVAPTGEKHEETSDDNEISTAVPTIETEEQENPSSTESLEEVSDNITGLVPSKEYNEEDIRSTTSLPSIVDTEDQSVTSVHTIAPSLQEEESTGLLEISPPSTIIPATKQEQEHFDITTEESEKGISATTASALSPIDETEEPKQIGDKMEHSTIIPGADDEIVESVTTLEDEYLKPTAISTVKSIIETSTYVAPISESEEDKKQAPMSTAEKTVEEAGVTDIQPTYKPISEQTSAETLDIATGKPTDFETKIDTSSAVPAMDEVKTSISSEEDISEYTGTTASATIEKVEEEKETEEDYTQASSTDKSEPEKPTSISESVPAVDKVTIPSIDEAEEEIKSSTAHTVATSEEQEHVTKSPIAFDDHKPEEDIKHITTEPSILSTAAEEVSTDLVPVEGDESDKQKAVSLAEESTTAVPSNEGEITHTPSKQPSLDLSEEASGESEESEEEISTDPTKIQHVGEFVTERIEETSSSPSEAGISGEEQKETSGEDEIEEMPSTTEKPHQPTDEEIKPIAVEKLPEDEIATAESVTTQQSPESILSVTKSPMAEDFTVQQPKEQDLLVASVTKAPLAEQEIKDTSAKEPESVTTAIQSTDNIQHVTTHEPEIEEEILVEQGSTQKPEIEIVSSEQPATEGMEYVNESEEEILSHTKSPIAVEDTTAQQMEGEDTSVATNAPVSIEEIDTVTAKQPEEDDVEHATYPVKQPEEEVMTSITKSPIAADEIENVTSQDKEGIASSTQTSLEAVTGQPADVLEESDLTTDKLPTEELGDQIKEHVHQVPQEEDADAVTSKPQISEATDEAKPSKEIDENVETTTVPNTLEETETTTKLSIVQQGDELFDVTTEVEKESEKKDKPSAPTISQEEEEPVTHISTESTTKISESDEETESTDLPIRTDKEHESAQDTTTDAPTEFEGGESTDAHELTDKLHEAERESHKDDLPIPVSDLESTESVTEKPGAGFDSVSKNESRDETTEVSLEADRITEIVDHATDMPIKNIESEKVEKELPERVTESSTGEHVSSDELPEGVIKLEEDSSKLPETFEQVTDIPTRGTEREEDKVHTEKPTGVDTSTVKLPEISENATELSSESAEPEMAEHITELPAEGTEAEDKENKYQEKPAELPEHATILPIEDNKSETTDEFSEISQENVTESEGESHQKVTEAPSVLSVSTDAVPEVVTELSSKDVEKPHELPVDAQEIPTKDIKTEDKVKELPSEVHELPELEAHVTDTPTKDVKTEEDTELPIMVSHDVSTVGQAVDQSTETVSKEEDLYEETTASESNEEITDDRLLPTTTVYPIFPHITTTLPTVPIDSRIDDTNLTFTAHSTAAPASPTIPTSTTTPEPITTAAPQHYQPQAPIYGQPPQYGPTQYEDEYTDEDEGEVFGPGTCRYGGKLYVSAQQIPRDDPCDFCFCFRSDIICLQQSCPPPIAGCHEEPISGFCCPRYECPVSMATVLNITTSTTTTSTTLPPHFLHHSYGNNVQRNGCLINGRSYRVGEKIESTSGPCINCTCGGDGKMKCDPQACVPEPTMQQVMAVVAAGRKR